MSEEEVYVFPASYAQQRLWFLDRFEPNSPYYNIPCAVRLRGRLEHRALEQAINEIVRRQEALRTTFASSDGKPVQVIVPRLAIAVPVVVLAHLPAAEREAEALRLATAEARKPFDLSAGPLLRVTLLRLDEAEHMALVTMHHIISDGWSIGVFVGELATLYDAFSRGEGTSPLPDLPIQYADFACWQQEWIQGTVLEQHLAYWRERLATLPPVLELPADRPRPAVITNRGSSASLKLTKSLTEAIKDLSRRENATPFMTLLGAFQTLLYRYTGQTDISVGSPIANRNRAEIEGLIGIFINTLVLRSDLGGDPTFRELLRRVRETSLGAFAHQDLPFEMLVEELQPERDMSHSPLFQVMFILQNAPGRTQELPGLKLEFVDVDMGTATFDLTLSMAEEADGFDASIEYNTDIFDASTIERMLGHFQKLLEGIVADPGQRLSCLPLLTPDEHRRLLREWNATDRDYLEGRPAIIHGLFEEQAARTPDAVAVAVVAVAEDSTTAEITYGELDRRANQLARHLRTLGVGPEVLVGVSLDKSLETIIAVMGVLKAGGAYLPIDPNYPQDRVSHMLTDSRAAVILTTEPILADLNFQPGADSSRIVCLDRDWPRIATMPDSRPIALTEPHPDQLAYVIYTSGSTGQSKGAMVSHRGIVNQYLAWEEEYRLRGEVTTHLQMAAFSFDVFTGDLVRALCSGGKLVLCPRELLLEPDRMYALMRRQGVDAAEFVPAVLRQLVQYLEDTRQSLDFMRLLVCGSDSWYVGEYQRFRRLCGPATRLLNSFGLTEATIDSCYFEGSVDRLPADRLAPIGRPFGNTRLYVLDQQMQPLPVGVVGELYVGGLGVARGYLNRPHLTAERFVPNPFLDGGSTAGTDKAMQRLYRTGDMARYLPDGNVEFLGRLDQQLKIRGFRIEPGEIEAVLGSHAQVRQAVVAARQAPTGDQRLVAYIVPAQGREEPTGSELRRYLLDRLADYMTPSAFVVVEALPLMPNGKVDRAALPEPDWSKREMEGEFVAPRTPTEEVLAQIWSQVLGLEAGRVGIYDNFFELGGHSLLATQLVSRVRDAFDVDLPLRNVFESPTVITLAEQIEVMQRTAAGVQAPPIRPTPRDQDLPLSFAQQRLWFLDQLEPNSPFYNLPEAVRLRGPMDESLLERSLNEVVRRHESLRTTFRAVAGRPAQIIASPEACRIPLAVVDLTSLSPAERETEAARLAGEEMQTPFDLAAGPLLRAKLLRLSGNERIILLTMHHIVGDDWSSSVLVQELTILYNAFAQGLPSPLPELPIQYADFAAWQRQWVQGQVLQALIDYWKGELAGLPPLLDLPTDRPRPAVQTYNGDYFTFSLPADLSGRIKQLCRNEGVTPFMALLAAFQTLLYRYSGQRDIAVGTPIANRNRADIEGLIGFFVNTLVLRARFGDQDSEGAAPSFRQVLRQVRESALGAYAHQDLPFETIVDALQPERNLSHSPLFQTMFVLQNAPMQAQELPQVGVAPVEAHSGTSKFDLTLFMLEEGERLSGALEYNTDLFDRATMERMVSHFQRLLEAVTVDPAQSVAAIPLLSDVERRRILVEWNDTAIDAGRAQDLPIHRWFEEVAARQPHAIAVEAETQANDGTTVLSTLTFAELNERANRLAHRLQGMGVGPETLVGVCLDRAPEMVVGLLGVLKAGGAYLPLDPAYPPDRLAFMIEDGRATVLLTQERLRPRLTVAAADGSPVTVLCLDSEWDGVAGESVENLIGDAEPDTLAYVIYTSGSTGRPKGAMITHRGLTNYLLWCLRAYPLDGGSGAPVHSSISFDLTVTSLWAPLVAGRRVRLAPEDVGVEALLSAMRDPVGGEFSLIKITPAHLELLSRQLKPEEAAGRTRSFIIGGENLPAETIAFWRRHAPDTMLVNEYGPTETVVGCCVYIVPPSGAAPASGSVPIGKPIVNTRLYILDETLQPVPIGVAGELYIGGLGVGRGYLRRPDLTAERFVPNPFAEDGDAIGSGPGSRLYRTGDLARYRADGVIEYLGRTDHQVKILGFRIELGEVNAALSRHPAVKEAFTLARETEPGAPRRLVAYVVPRTQEDSASLIGELRGFLRQSLPEYMVPSAFVALEELPLTANGKVDRAALPAPEFGLGSAEAVYVAPRTPEEEIIAGIWAETLDGTGMRIGVHDNFFDLGGHSLLATQVISRLRDAFDVELPLRDLFEAPTVAGLAERVALARRSAQGLAAPPMKPTPRDGDLPLSFAQQRLWFLDQLDPGSPLYNIPAAVRLRGPLDLAALERSLNAIVQRHEALRTTFETVDGRPRQVIHPRMPVTLTVIDLRRQPADAEQREAKLRRQLAEEAMTPFDLAAGPLLRVHLWRLDDDEAVALLNMHHIVSDDWSMGVLMQELSAFYAGGSDSEAPLLPPLPVQYADFARWQRAWLEGAGDGDSPLQRQLAYWKQQLSGLPPVLELPTDRPRPPVQTFGGGRSTFTLPKALADAVKSLNRETGSTLFMTLLAAFQTLLFRYTSEEDFAVGTPIANRTRSEIEGLIGFFVNTLVLRATLSGDMSFRRLAERVRETALGAYAHQDVPFEMLVDRLHPQRDMNHSPLFQVMFVLQNAPRGRQEMGGDLVVSPMETEDAVARFDLTLTMLEDGDELGGSLEYNADLFDGATIERMAGHFTTLLEGIVADPDLPIGRLPMLTAAERQQIAEWNRVPQVDDELETGAGFTLDCCAHDLFAAQAAATPDAVAVIVAAGEIAQDVRISYAELDRRANQLAHHLRSLGVGPETVVGICVDRSLEMVVGLLGIMKAGGAYLPLDPTYPADRLAFILADAQVPVLLTHAPAIESLSAPLSALSDRDAPLTLVRLDADWEVIARNPAGAPRNLVTPDHLAYVIYTSGSTGRPKGVLLQHRGLTNLVSAQTRGFGVDASCRILQFASFSFDASVSEVFMALLTGATLVLAPSQVLAAPDELRHVLQEQAITTVTLPPSMLRVLPANDLPLLHTVISAGEACPPDIAARWCAGRRMFNAYGPTEATVGPTFHAVAGVNERNATVPIGRPIANLQVYLLDAELQPAPVGVPGEICIGGVGLARGYLNRPDLTAEKFVPMDSGRLYRTGDLARFRPDGQIEYLGRIDHQVKVRGFRIELGEIETALSRHPSLRQAVVVAQEDQPGVKRLVAFVVPAAGQETMPNAGELRGFLQQTLPEYMVPQIFAVLDALPLTPNGKIDRRALSEGFGQQARLEVQAPYVAPRTPEEETLAAIWAEMLKVERVGIHDNFFELGGDSILSIQIVARANQAGLALTPRLLFEHPTVAGLAGVAAPAHIAKAETPSSDFEAFGWDEEDVNDILSQLDKT